MIELMLPERQEKIRVRLAADGRVLAASLAEEFGVSEDTIRRDLRDMAAAGLCERVYGGALPVSQGRTSLSQRLNVDRDRKRVLARAMVSLIEPGSVVFFDAGSTNLAIAEMLPDALVFTAVTNAPSIAVCLNDKPSVGTILIGGTVDRMVGGAVGAQALESVSRLAPDLCFIGACGLDEEAVLAVFSFEDAAFKRAIMARSRRTATAVTKEKFTISAPFPIALPGQYHCLVTEEDADPSRLAAIQARGCDVIIARP